MKARNKAEQNLKTTRKESRSTKALLTTCRVLMYEEERTCDGTSVRDGIQRYGNVSERTYVEDVHLPNPGGVIYDVSIDGGFWMGRSSPQSY